MRKKIMFYTRARVEDMHCVFYILYQENVLVDANAFAWAIKMRIKTESARSLNLRKGIKRCMLATVAGFNSTKGLYVGISIKCNEKTISTLITFPFAQLHHQAA